MEDTRLKQSNGGIYIYWDIFKWEADKARQMKYSFVHTSGNCKKIGRVLEESDIYTYDCLLNKFGDDLTKLLDVPGVGSTTYNILIRRMLNLELIEEDPR